MKKKLTPDEIEAIKATVVRTVTGWVQSIRLLAANKIADNPRLGKAEIVLAVFEIERQLGVVADNDAIQQIVNANAPADQLTDQLVDYFTQAA